MFQNLASDVGGYLRMPSLNEYTVAALGTSTESVTTTPTILEVFATNL